MIRRLRGLGSLCRVEWRAIAHHPAQTLFPYVLVAIPVAALTAFGLLAFLAEPTAQERTRSLLGAADLRIEGLEEYDRRHEALQRLASSPSSLIWIGVDEVAIPGQCLRARAWAIEPGCLADGGLGAGMLQLESGRWPGNPGEVALSNELLDALAIGLGDEVRLMYGRRRRVSGVVVNPEAIREPLIVRTKSPVEQGGQTLLLASVSPEVQKSITSELADAGFPVLDRDAAAGESDAFAVSAVFAAGCVAIFEAGLLMAAAFGVGTMRRRREMGLLGATGVSGGQLVTTLVVSTVMLAWWFGTAGSLIGVGLAWFGHGWLDDWNGRRNGPFDWQGWVSASAVMLGVVVSAVAVLGPALHTARTPVREALLGRRPSVIQPVRGGWVGLAILVAGLGLILLLPRETNAERLLGIVVGPLAILAGIGLCSPFLLGVFGRHAGRLPVAWRLAVRDAGRFQTRYGPAVTAIVAGMSISVAVATIVASIAQAVDFIPGKLNSTQLLVEGPNSETAANEIFAALGGRTLAPWQAAYVGNEPLRLRPVDGPSVNSPRGEWAAIGNQSLLRAMAADAAEMEFDAGDVIMLGPEASKIRADLSRWQDKTRLGTVDVTVVKWRQPIEEPRFLIHQSGALAQTMGLRAGPPLDRSVIPWVVDFPDPVSGAKLRDARELAAGRVGTTVTAKRELAGIATQSSFILLGLCGFTSVLIAFIATSLSAAEAAADTRTLEAIGAAPRVIRKYAAGRGSYLAMVGCVMSIPTGLLIAKAMFETVNFPVDLVIPWCELFLCAVGVPLVVYWGTWAAAVLGFQVPGMVRSSADG